MTDAKDRARREAELAAALRANLRRRKAPSEPPKPVEQPPHRSGE
jgi:hypothetical protein